MPAKKTVTPTKTHFTFTANGKEYEFPHVEQMPAGFTYYSQKASAAASNGDYKKAMEYNNKVYDAIFGEDSAALDAIMMHFRQDQQQALIKEWMEFEGSRFGVDAGKL